MQHAHTRPARQHAQLTPARQARQARQASRNAKTTLPRDATQPGRDRGYSLRQFLSDQARLLVVVAPNAPEHPSIIDVIDGRMIAVHPELCQWDQSGDYRRLLGLRYGPRPEPAISPRFRAVLVFLQTWRAEVEEAGLATGEQPMAVREEFVESLVRYRLGAGESEIPKSAIYSFLDEWGHRWI